MEPGSGGGVTVGRGAWKPGKVEVGRASGRERPPGSLGFLEWAAGNRGKPVFLVEGSGGRAGEIGQAHAACGGQGTPGMLGLMGCGGEGALGREPDLSSSPGSRFSAVGPGPCRLLCPASVSLQEKEVAGGASAHHGRCWVKVGCPSFCPRGHRGPGRPCAPWPTRTPTPGRPCCGAHAAPSVPASPASSGNRGSEPRPHGRPPRLESVSVCCDPVPSGARFPPSFVEPKPFPQLSRHKDTTSECLGAQTKPLPPRFQGPDPPWTHAWHSRPESRGRENGNL